MELQDDIKFFLDKSSSAYFIGSLESQKTIFLNQTGKKMFGMCEENFDYSKIFDRSDAHIQDIITQSLKAEKSCLVYDLLVKKQDGTKVLVDLELGYFNCAKTLVYLQLIPQKQGVETLTMHQVNHSVRAEGILNFDEYLTLLFCNPNFFRLFGATKPSDLDAYQQQLSRALVSSQRETLCQNMIKSLKEREMYSIEVEIFTLSGEKKWLALDLQKRHFQDEGEKILCYATDIDDKKKTTGSLSLKSISFYGARIYGGFALPCGFRTEYHVSF